MKRLPCSSRRFGNRFWHQGLDQPIAALPLQIYAYAIAPYDDWHRQAWAGALVLIALVLITSLAARLATRGRFAADEVADMARRDSCSRT